MLPRWLDLMHQRLWRVESDAQLFALQKRARCAAATVAPKLDALPDDHRWNNMKAEILAILDEAGLLTCLNDERPSTVALSLVFFELARIDGGLVTLALAGCLPQMLIAEFGSDEQKAQYLGQLGALCLTEPLPGAGSDALLLTGRFRRLVDEAGLEPWIEVEKRGRFTSHMEFAEFVVAAVQGEDGARGSALVILEPSDTGLFDRGSAVRKIGHQISSTTNPIFQLRIPASRIVGGFDIEEGLLRPRVDHRRALHTALQRTRALLSLTTAAKAFAALEEMSEWPFSVAEYGVIRAELWAAGEAAAALGFAAVRACDDSSNETAAILSSAAKLYSTTVLPPLLRSLAGNGSETARKLLADAQVETMYLGPESTQRRILTAALANRDCKGWLGSCVDEIDGIHCQAQLGLAASFKLFSALHTRMNEERGGSANWLADEQQPQRFAMADTLSALLAAWALQLDAARLEGDSEECAVFNDLAFIVTASAGAQVAQLACGVYSPGGVEQEAAEVWQALAGFQYARERVAQILVVTDG